MNTTRIVVPFCGKALERYPAREEEMPPTEFSSPQNPQNICVLNESTLDCDFKSLCDRINSNFAPLLHGVYIPDIAKEKWFHMSISDFKKAKREMEMIQKSFEEISEFKVHCFSLLTQSTNKEMIQRIRVILSHVISISKACEIDLELYRLHFHRGKSREADLCRRNLGKLINSDAPLFLEHDFEILSEYSKKLLEKFTADAMLEKCIKSLKRHPECSNFPLEKYSERCKGTSLGEEKVEIKAVMEIILKELSELLKRRK